MAQPSVVDQPAAARRPIESALVVATYVLLVAIGVASAGLEAFLVPQRVAGVAGLSVALALLGNLTVGVIGGIGLRSYLAAVAPSLGWMVMELFASSYASGGDVILPGKLQNDPAIVNVATGMLLCGLLGSALALVITARYTRRVIAPTPQA